MGFFDSDDESSSYLDGVAEQVSLENALEQQRVVLGAGSEKVYTDKTTVKSAQIALKELSRKTGKSVYDPIEIDGKIGPHTRAAVSAFNRDYGWPADADQITEGTFIALMRPDVMDATKASAAAPPAPLPPTPKQVEQMTAPVVTAPSSFGDAQEELPSRPTSLLQRERPRAEPPNYGKWVFVGITGVAGLGVLWLLVDALRGRRNGAPRSGGAASRHTFVDSPHTLAGYRRK